MSRCITRTCGGQYQITLPYNSQQCGRCENCQWPRFMPDQFKLECIPRPFAQCGCREKHSADRYTCEPCPAGFVQDPNNSQRCLRPTCTGQYQIQLAIDEYSCGACEDCQWPRFMPNTARSECIERPFASCNCLSRRSNDGYSCERCPNNQVSSEADLYNCYEPMCNGQYSIRTAFNANSCAKCQDCQWPNFIPNNDRTRCVPRPKAQCDCL